MLDAAHEVGLSGGGRLHDLFVDHEAMTPGDYKRRGEGLEMVYGFHASPFGEALLLATAARRRRPRLRRRGQPARRAPRRWPT